MQEALRQIFDHSFAQFVGSERSNIMNGVSERNLCARLASIVEQKARETGLEDYFADVEYNRNFGGRVKTIIDDQMKVVTITCDLILHSRGSKLVNDNLIAVEMKRREHRSRDKSTDRVRLQALTKASYDDIWSADGQALPEHVCGYHLGYFAELDISNRKFVVEEYVRGRLSKQREFKF